MRSPGRALALTSQCRNHTGSDNAAGETPVVALRERGTLCAVMSDNKRS